VIVMPAIDVLGGRCVRLERGDPDRATEYEGDPVEVALRFEAAGGSMLHVVDLDAALGVGSNRGTVEAICRAVSIPVQVGGGLRTTGAVGEALNAGARRAVLGTAAVIDPAFVSAVVSRHGDRIVGAVDVRGGRAMLRGWREVGPPVEDLVPALDGAGCPRYLVTSVQADGMLEGPDLGLYARILTLTERPVLASGGIRSSEDLDGLAALGLEGAVVGKALYEGALPLSVIAEGSRT
jgi:phosphoribosyl isomerase A